MLVIDNDLQIKDIDLLTLFNRSISTIYKILGTMSPKWHNHYEDIMQECALRFFTYISKYDYTKRVIIGVYIKQMYVNVIKNYTWKQYRNTFDILDEQIIADDTHSYDLNLDCLTDEQKQICYYILAGYDYTEICEMLLPNHNCQDKKRPIYRRVCEIKSKLAKIYEIDYIMPDHSGNRRKYDL